MAQINTYYVAQFSPDWSIANDYRVLWEDLSQVSPREAGMHNAPVTFEELTGAHIQLSRGKSPGLDRLSEEIFSAFWDILGGCGCWGHDYVSILEEYFLAQELLLSRYRVAIMPLPNKGKLCLFKNWGPISLLSMDYEIFTR
eukprot:g30864.t1